MIRSPFLPPALTPTHHPSASPPASPTSRAQADRSVPIERGQSTAEYALVLVAVTSMVAVVIAYVSGDGGGIITGLFGAAFAKMRALVGA